MTQTNLSYKGITRTPSDLQAEDGQLAECVNLISENGEIQPIATPQTTLRCDGQLLFIHNTNTHRNYIVNHGGFLKFFHQTTSGIQYYPSTVNTNLIGETSNATCLGNTLILSAEKGLFYLLFKDNDYHLLGQKPPFIPLSFSLKGTIVQTEQFTIDIEDQRSTDPQFTDNNATIVTNAVIPKVNKLIADNSASVGKFIYPFLVRYAFRLYDDTLFMHSAPVLMIPSTVMAPLAITEEVYTGSPSALYVKELKTQIKAHACTLEYLFTGSNSLLQELQNWTSIVKSIDIFISEPIYSYDPNGKCTQTDYSAFQYWGLLNLDNETENGKPIYKKNYISKDRDNPTTIQLPAIPENTFKQQIENCALFYKITSIPVSALTTQRTTVEIKNGILATLPLQERMSDDYSSHNLIRARYTYVYNSRLNLSGISQIPFSGFPADTLTCYANQKAATTAPEEKEYAIDLYTFIRDNDQQTIVKTTANIPLAQFPQYLYYPNTKAYKCVIVRKKDSTTMYAELPLTPHKNLNGSFYFNFFKSLTWTTTYDTSQLTPTQSPAFDLPNKIYTSEVNNPFNFPVSGINTVGAGEILGIASATKALSQGQFGQFPLYAFTTEGIWALEISPTGTYSSKQIVTRDVCNNPSSITQIDGAIIFSSDRGVILLQGSETQCLSDPMRGRHFRSDTLQHIAAFKPEIQTIITDTSDPLTFADYIRGCAVAYDYPNARLIFNNPDTRYQYIYSLRSATFAKFHHGKQFLRVINAYPDCYMQDNNGNIYNYSAILDENHVPLRTLGILVTRPLTFGTTTLKTITRTLNRGTYAAPSYVKIALYASRDGATYYKLHSLRGMAWRFFRLVIYANLLPSERLSFTSFMLEEKFTNKMR